MRPFLPAALLSAALAPCCCWSATAQTPSGERIGGTLQHALTGMPIAHARVVLRQSGTETEVATTTSELDGRFLFPAVPPGRYSLFASARGFAVSAYLQHGNYWSAVVTGAGLPTGSLVMRLSPAATIRGHVTDEVGDPLPTAVAPGPAELTLYCSDPIVGDKPYSCGQQPTRADGTFAFADLKPGTYYLTVQARPWYAVSPPIGSDLMKGTFRQVGSAGLDVTYPLLYFPNATSSEHAQQIVLRPGEAFTADFQLLPERALSIAVPHPAGQETWIYPFLYRDVFGTRQMVPTLMNSVDNTAYYLGLPPGTYTLEEVQMGGVVAAREQTVSLTDESVVAPPMQATHGSGTVTLHITALPNLAGPALVCLKTGDKAISPFRPADAKGDVAFQQVPSGEYGVGTPAGESVHRLLVHGKASTDKLFRLEEGASLKADVEISAPVEVHGIAQRSGKPAVAAMVVLVPADASAGPEAFRRDQADMDGGFRLQDVRPGRYLLIALDDAWSLNWTDTHLLEPYLLHALPVIVPAENTGPVRIKAPVLTQALR